MADKGYTRFYLTSDTSQTVDFKVPEFGNLDELDFNQAWGKTEGGQVFVEDPGFVTQQLKLDFRNVKDTQRFNFEEFFENVLLRGRMKCDLRIAGYYPKRTRRMVHCGMTVTQTDGSEDELTADLEYDGSYITCDQLLPPTYIYLVGYRIMDGVLRWADAQDGYWDISLNLTRDATGWENR